MAYLPLVQYGYGVCEESINRTFLLLGIGIIGRNVNHSSDFLGDYNLRLLPYKDLPPRSNKYCIQLLCLLCVILAQRFWAAAGASPSGPTATWSQLFCTFVSFLPFPLRESSQSWSPAYLCYLPLLSDLWKSVTPFLHAYYPTSARPCHSPALWLPWLV